MVKWIKKLFGKSDPIVPVLRLSGMIAASSGPRRGLSMAAMAPLIDKAFDVKGAKAVALVINSPGGSPVQSSLIYDRIRLLSREKDIPVLAFVEDVAASGGYWLACAGDEIYVNPSSVVGSIGVISAGHQKDGATAAHKRHSKHHQAPKTARSWPDGRCPPQPPCHRAGGSHSLGQPNIAVRSG